MDTVPILPLLSRWLHILGAVTFAGGTVYMYVALRGAMASGLSKDARDSFRREIMARWKHVIELSFVLIFGSGFYNYFALTRHAHPDQPLYHALFGTKFLLAIAAFGLAFVVTSTMEWSAGLREKPLMWRLAVGSVLGVILIAGYMKLMPAWMP